MICDVYHLYKQGRSDKALINSKDLVSSNDVISSDDVVSSDDIVINKDKNHLKCFSKTPIYTGVLWKSFQ